jgi:aspartate/methionine/tyrosine aminotransferase
VFSLGGISKLLGLPQLKLAWIAVTGIDSVVTETLARLEIAYDTYLSVTTAVQGALGSLLESGHGVHEQIATRIRHNCGVLQRVAAEVPSCRVLPVGGGWSAVIRVPTVVSEERRVLELLEKHRVLVHPGYFFEFPEEAFLVCSLIPEPEVFATGVARLINGLGRAPVTE